MIDLKSDKKVEITMQDIEVFPWHKNFATGIPSIDEQHKRLVQLINQAASLLGNNATQGDIDRVLEELTDYANYHFLAEEQVWSKYFADDAASLRHQRVHKSFISRVGELKAEEKTLPVAELTERLLKFLINWLALHILKEDMEMAKAVHHMDEGSNLEVAKLAATEEMKDSRILIETVLGMYHTLSERTLALMRERAHRQVLTDSLIQSERRERQFSDAVMNSVPGLVFVCDVKWRLVKWNEPCEEVTGRSGEDLANRSFWSLFDQNQLKQDQLKNVQAHAESWSGVTPYEFEVRVIGAEGEVVPYLFTSHYIDLEGSRYVTAVGVDISERHSKELELSESRERYAEAQRIAGLGIWEYDHESADIYWSDELYKIYELDKASFTLSSQSIVERIHPDDQGLVNRGYRDAFSNRRPLEIEYRILAQDGHVKYVRESLAHSFIDDDRLARTVGTVMDVTRNVLEQQALEESARQIRQALQGTLSAMSKALEIKDPYTAGHQERVALLAAAIAGKLGLSEDEIEGVRIGAGIHDLGQIAIPAQILSKPGPLSDTEFSIVKTHTEVGETILSEVDFPWPVNDIIAQHHERLDGSGYPDGLVGDQICREALIVAVADVFEAMTAFRPFRASLGADAAFEELLTNRGNLYDPEVVDALVAVVEESPELATPQL